MWMGGRPMRHVIGDRAWQPCQYSVICCQRNSEESVLVAGGSKGGG